MRTQNKEKKTLNKQESKGSKDEILYPRFVAASAILLACEQHGREISVEKVANATGISESKLRKLYPEIRACMINNRGSEAG